MVIDTELIEYYSFKSKDECITFKTDLCAKDIRFVYADDDLMCSSTNLLHILNYLKSRNKLNISKDGLSYLLQSGLVPNPGTIFNNLYKVGIGDTLEVINSNTSVNVRFKHLYPFLNKEVEGVRSENSSILNSVRRAVDKDIQDQTIMFYSAGKDSNLIFSSMIDSDLRENVHLVTHKSKGHNDESEICRKLAKKFDFKHSVLQEVDRVGSEHREVITSYFERLPFPTIDNVSLAYPLYSMQMPELLSANIMIGDGNDSYLMVPPQKRDLLKYNLSKVMSLGRPINKYINSESILNPLMRTAAEWSWIEGYNEIESEKILGHKIDSTKHWINESKRMKDLSLIDFKTDIYQSNTIEQIFIMKFRLACYVWESNLKLPLMDEEIVRAFRSLPQRDLYNLSQNKNKIVIRDIIKEKIDLDSDKIGKKGYNYDSKSFIHENWRWVKEEVLECSFWNKKETERIINRLERNSHGSRISERLALRLIYRIFLISMWLNHSSYAKELK